MEQKFLIVDSQYEVQSWLDKGWRITSITAQHIATGSSRIECGKFAIVLERNQNT